MSWINLCSSRHALQAALSDDELDDGETSDDPPTEASILLHCAILGDLERLRRNANTILEAYREWETYLANSEQIPTNLPLVQKYLTLSVTLKLIGEEDKGIANWVAGVPFGKDRVDRTMARIVAVLGGETETGKLEPPTGHTLDAMDWPVLALRTPVADLLDLVACPNHPYWYRLQYWMTPAAAAFSVQSGAPVAELLRWGRHVVAAERVIHERTAPAPATGPRGFDSVLNSPDGPIGCYDLSMVDIYHSPEELAEILSGAPQDWKAAGHDGEALRVYHDPDQDRIDAADLAKAAKKTGTRVSLHSFLEAP